MALASINRWCTPAYVFLVISILFVLIVYVQNSSNYNVFCLGSGAYCNFSKKEYTTLLIFKFIFILFWTWILNLLCRSGFSALSWVLLLLPFFFVIITMSMMYFKP